MQSTPDPYDPAAVEQATRQFWRSRGLPPADGSVGPPTGARIHQIIGTIASDRNPVALAQGGVLADVDARFFAVTGRRSVGRILVRPSREEGTDPRTPALLEAAGAWAGGAGPATRDPARDAERLQRMVERLAATGILVRRESPLRSCPRCRVPRTLAGILYHEEEGPAYLVRFPLAGATPPVSLVVWTDAVWKLLGAPAILAQADAPYVIVRYRRRGSEERVLVAKSSLPHLQSWLPGGEWEVVEELSGATLEGRAYDHPLGTESPMLGRPPAPSGQVHLSSEVTDSGTGFVALVPAHGAADAAASRALDLPGWPVLDHDLALTSSFRHKYQGLPLEAGEAFVVRDLRESGYLFAELTVRRGVPRCAVCRTPLVWETGSAWCLVPAALPAARLDLFARLIPGERAPPSTEVVPWPVSGGETVEDPLAPELRECDSCHRLGAAASGPACFCGGATRAYRRRLLPVFREALLAWADESPFPPGEAVRLYLPAQRRVPTLIHHLVAMEAAEANPGEVTIHALASLPLEQGLDEWLVASPRDAARAALASLTVTPRGGGAALVERRSQHAHRLRRYWALAQTVAGASRADRTLGGMPPIASRYPELLDEDRALLSRFERMRREVLGAYESGDAAEALRLLDQFFDGPLRSIYLPAAARRLPGSAPERGPVLALLAHILVTWSELYGPVAPFTAEAVSRLFVADGRSVFERPLTPILESALDSALEERSNSWWEIVEAARRARRHLGIADAVVLPQIVLGARDDARAAEFRVAHAVIGRLVNAAQVEVASPQQPWSGRRLEVTPVLPALQKVFGSGAARVARILQGLSPQRVRDGIRSKTLEIAVEGRPVPIGPGMVEFVEQLPDGFVSFPWTAGELIVQVPGGAPSTAPEALRVVSPDAYKVLRRVRQRIRWSARPEAVRVVVVCATGALSEELVRLAPSLATALGVPLFRVVASTDGFPLSETTTGRTGRGLAWSVWVPGSRRPESRTTEQRAARARQERIRRAIRRDPTPEVSAEIQSDPSVRRDAEIERWVQRLDEAVGRPLVGPAKLRAAWDAGLQQYEDLIHAPYDRLAALPGFGPVVAAELITRVGGTVPLRDRPPMLVRTSPVTSGRPRRSPDPPAASTTALPSAPVREVGFEPPVLAPSDPDSQGGGASRTGAAIDELAPPSPPTPDRVEDRGPSPLAGPAPQDRDPTPTEPEHDGDGSPDRPPVPISPDPPTDAEPLSAPGPTSAPSEPVGPALESAPIPAAVAQVTELPSVPSSIDPVPHPEPSSAVEEDALREVGVEPVTAGNVSPAPDADLSQADLDPRPAPDPSPTPTMEGAVAPPVPATPVADMEPRLLPPDGVTPGEGAPSVERPPEPPATHQTVELPAPPSPPEPTAVGAEASPDASDTAAVRPTDPVSGVVEVAPVEGVTAVADREPTSERPADTEGTPARAESTPSPPSGTSPLEPAASEPDLPPPPEEPTASPPGPAEPAPVIDQPPARTPLPPDEPDADTSSPPSPGRTPEGAPADAEHVALPVPVALPEPALEIPAEPLVVVERGPLAGPSPELPPSAPEPGPPSPQVAPELPLVAAPTALTPEPLPAPAEIPRPPRPPASGLAVSSATLANDAWPLFLDATGAGHRGLCVSREFPDRMRALLGPRDVTIVWLSNSTRPGSIRPTDLEGLAQAIERQLATEQVRAVYLDHVEYLARVNSTATVRAFLERVDAAARANEARAWVALNPTLLSDEAAAALARGFPAAH